MTLYKRIRRSWLRLAADVRRQAELDQMNRARVEARTGRALRRWMEGL